MKLVVKKPYGRSLKDFLPLLPAEIELRHGIRLGKTAHIGNTRPAEKTQGNCIRAAFLRFLALGGDESAPTHEKGIELAGAWISGMLDLEGCEIPSSFCVIASHFEHPPIFRDAHIHGLLVLSGSQLPGLGGDRLIADGGVLLRQGFVATQEVRLIGAQIGGYLECTGSSFTNEGGHALSADGANIKGCVFLSKNFAANGEVRFIHAHIGGNLNCSNSSFSNEQGIAILADGTNINGDFLLSDEFKARGEVRLVGALISGNLDCGGGSFTNEHGSSLVADSAKIQGNVFFSDDFKAIGEVCLLGAQIAGDFSCEGGEFFCTTGDAVIAARIQVGGSFQFRKLKSPVKGINLSSSRVRQLADDEASWGEGMVLDGFTYGSFSSGAPCRASDRLEWLAKQRDDHYQKPLHFRPQPWKQLIWTLRDMGHHEDARQAAIAYETHRRQSGMLHGPAVCMLHWLFGLFIGYGYRPLRLVRIMLGVWLFCAAMYWTAALHGVFAPGNPLVFHHSDYQHCRPDYPLPGKTQEKAKFGNWYLCPELAGEYTGFSPLAYSLDLLLPLVDLQQEHDWAPYIPTPKAAWYSELWQFFDEDNWKFHITRLLVWIEILFGWVASLLLVAVVSGLTSHDKDD